MAKRRYRPYRTRKERNRRQMRTIALAMIVLIVGVFILIKSGNDTQPQEANGSERVPVDSILPVPQNETSESAETEPAFEPPAIESETEETTETAEATEPSQMESESISVTEDPVVETVRELSPTININTTIDVADESSPEAKSLIEKANELRGSGKIIAARDLLNHTLDLKLSAMVRAAVKERMAKLAQTWLFTRDVYESDNLTGYYLVQSGDLLAVIAKRYKVPYQALMRINNIERAELLQAGVKIKFIQGPFNAVIYKSSYTMDLYLQNVYVKTYRVGLGKEEYETPTGRWRVKKGGKLVKPRWTDPDNGKVYVGSAPDYPLGSRWIAIEGLDENTKNRTGFALHGTKDPDSIGARSSRGCIRLYNGDVIEVYDLLEEGVSEVLIVD